MGGSLLTHRWDRAARHPGDRAGAHWFSLSWRVPGAAAFRQALAELASAERTVSPTPTSQISFAAHRRRPKRFLEPDWRGETLSLCMCPPSTLSGSVEASLWIWETCGRSWNNIRGVLDACRLRITDRVGTMKSKYNQWMIKYQKQASLFKFFPVVHRAVR